MSVVKTLFWSLAFQPAADASRPQASGAPVTMLGCFAAATRILLNLALHQARL